MIWIRKNKLVAIRISKFFCRSTLSEPFKGNHDKVGLALALIACLFISFAFPALCATLADADQFLLQNQFNKAEDAYRELIETDEKGDAFAGLAVALAKQSWPAKILEAEKILRQARDKFSDNPNLLAAAGYVSFAHARAVAAPARRDLYLEAAGNLCDKALKVNPEIVIAQQTLGLVKLAQDDPEGAVTSLQKAASLAPDFVNLTLLAQALLKKDVKTEEAEPLIDKALGLKANYPPAHVQKALILMQKGKTEDAFMELNNIPEAGRSADWFLAQGDIYRKQGDGPSALASWNEAIRLDPHNADPYKHSADYYTVRGDGELAISEMHNALEILPNDMALRTKLAELALSQDKLDVAEAEYRTILASQPDDTRGLLGLTHVYFRKARRDGQYPPGWQQLMDQLQTVVSEQSVTGQVVKAGAKSLQESIELSEAEKSLAENHFKEAREHFTTVINNHKTDPFDLLNLGEQAFYDGDLASAEQAYKLAKDIPEVSPRADQWLNKINGLRNEAARQTELGNATLKTVPVAIDHFKQALIADSQYAAAYYGLYSVFARGYKPDVDKAIHYAICFLDAAEENNSLRPDVEKNLEKLKKRVGKPAVK
jgi:tetratricopeptide (TPR) repeat protein